MTREVPPEAAGADLAASQVRGGYVDVRQGERLSGAQKRSGGHE